MSALDLVSVTVDLLEPHSLDVAVSTNVAASEAQAGEDVKRILRQSLLQELRAIQNWKR